MRLIKIEKLPNGAHQNQTPSHLHTIPDGWAVIPDGMETMNFPFGEVTVKTVNGVPTVTSWTPGEIPEPEPEAEAEPTQLDIIEAQVTYTAMMTDTLLESEG